MWWWRPTLKESRVFKNLFENHIILCTRKARSSIIERVLSCHSATCTFQRWRTACGAVFLVIGEI